MPNNTLVLSMSKEPKSFKVPIDRVTAKPCGNAAGSIKFPLLFIHKSLNPRCFKNAAKSFIPVDYYAQESFWMDSSIFTTWFHGKLVPRCQLALGEKSLPKRAIPLLDNALSHSNIRSLCSSSGEISEHYVFNPTHGPGV